MSDIQAPRRRYQFTLRTPVLAITVSAVVLSSVPLIGPYYAVLLAAYFLALLAVSIWWGYEQGCPIAMLGTAILFCCPWIGWPFPIPSSLSLFLPAAFIIGYPVGFFCFLLIHAAFCVVERETSQLPHCVAEQQDGGDAATKPTGMEQDY